MIASPPSMEIQTWPIARLVLYARNPRKNDAAVDRMCGSIREFGFKLAVLARSDGEVVDGHLRLKAARKLGLTEIPVIFCDEWTPAQVKAFRLMVNRSVTWADWDDELLSLELLEIQESGFDSKEIDDLLLKDEPAEDGAPPLPDNPVTRTGDLWLCGTLEWSPKLRQSVKTQNPSKGELSHGNFPQVVHEGVQAGRSAAAGARGEDS